MSFFDQEALKLHSTKAGMKSAPGALAKRDDARRLSMSM
jgi:hypothetical protein